MEPFINIYDKDIHMSKDVHNHLYELSLTSRDRKKFFKRNKSYCTENVLYKHNSYGYRTIDYIPNEYILVLGCSHTYGSGLHEYERYSNILETELEIPVVNLGVPGTSINFILLNLLKLVYSSYKLPKAIICQYPNLGRLTLPRTDGLLNIVPSNTLYRSLYIDDSLDTHSRLCYQLIKDTAKTYNIKLIDFYLWNSIGDEKIVPIDYARDIDHPGPESNKLFADYILEKL